MSNSEDDSTHPSRAISSRKFILALGVVTLLIIGYAAVRIGYAAYKQNHPLSDPKWGFQYLEPTKLPPGFSIKAKRIDVASEAGVTYGVSADLNFRTEDWIYSIQESRDANGGPTTTQLKNYDPTSIGVTCIQETSPKGKRYRLCHWTDYGRISVYELKFSQGDTLINTMLPAAKGQIVKVSDLNTYVDSFTKARPPKQIVRGI